MSNGDALISWSDNGKLMYNIFLLGCSQNYRFVYPRRKEEYLKEDLGILHKQECDPKIVQSRQNSIFDHVRYFTSSSNLVQHRVVHDQRSLSTSLRSNHPSLDQTTSRLEREVVGIKRKVVSNCELDLNLSLGLESRNDENLSRSLNSISSSNSILIYKKLKGGTSTLDLTL